VYHVDFRIPNGGALSVVQRARVREQAIELIDKQLEDWKKQYGIPYKAERITDILYRVSFALEQDISFFKLSWEPKYYSTGWERIEIVDYYL
jgi:hypothetical protein